MSLGYEAGMSSDTGAQQSASWNSGINAAGSMGGQIGQGAAGIATSIVGILNMGRESPASKLARHRWESMRKPAADLLSQLFYNPAAEGGGVPYTPDAQYKWAPTQATQNLYSNYLNRQYGLSRGTAQAMTAQALKPVALGQLRGGTSSAAAYGGSRINAQALANAAMGTQQAGVMRSQDYLQNAGKLSAYNLWRAQQLGQTIG